jgi:hypothetical protein
MAGDEFRGFVGAALQRRDIRHDLVQQPQRQRFRRLDQTRIEDQVLGPCGADQRPQPFTVLLFVLPFLLLAYLICIIDRLNVGFAALSMNADLGFTSTVYGVGAGLFFFGYFLGEVPSNLILLSSRSVDPNNFRPAVRIVSQSANGSGKD